MDIVRQKQVREWTLLGLVATMALVANLPRAALESIGIEQGLLMAMLGLMVVFALFLYVRFFFFLIYFLLAIGANLPEQWAASLGISQTPMLIALIAMVSAVIAAYLYLKILVAMWVGDVGEVDADDETPVAVPFSMGALIFLAAAFTLVVGVYPGWLIDAADQVTQYAR